MRRRCLTECCRSAYAIVALSVVAGCTGPSVTEPTAADTLVRAVGQASSATEVGLLVVDLLQDGRTTTAVADTTLRDAAAEMWEAQGLLSREVPAGAEAVRVRDRAMMAVDAAAGALADARAWANGSGDPDVEQVEGALSDAADALTALDSEVSG